MDRFTPARDLLILTLQGVLQRPGIAGWVYYPHPETKKTHFQNPALIEVITYQIPKIQYGDGLEIEINAEEILVYTHAE